MDRSQKTESKRSRAARPRRYGAQGLKFHNFVANNQVCGVADDFRSVETTHCLKEEHGTKQITVSHWKTNEPLGSGNLAEASKPEGGVKRSRRDSGRSTTKKYKFHDGYTPADSKEQQCTKSISAEATLTNSILSHLLVNNTAETVSLGTNASDQHSITSNIHSSNSNDQPEEQSEPLDLSMKTSKEQVITTHSILLATDDQAPSLMMHFLTSLAQQKQQNGQESQTNIIQLNENCVKKGNDDKRCTNGFLVKPKQKHGQDSIFHKFRQISTRYYFKVRDHPMSDKRACKNLLPLSAKIKRAFWFR